MHSLLSIVAVQKEVPAPGDFGIVVKDTALEVPQPVLNCMNEKPRSAEEVYDLASCFPSGFMQGLGWSLPEVKKAAEKLKQQLIGHVDDQFFSPLLPMRRGFGARDPKELHRSPKPS